MTITQAGPRCPLCGNTGLALRRFTTHDHRGDVEWLACSAGHPDIIAPIPMWSAEARAREEGAKAMHAAVSAELHKCGNPCPQCHDAIAALDPAQIAGGGK